MPDSLPNILKATADFEAWLARHLPVVRQDLYTKHASMAAAVFPFFRATFYRWAQLWPRVCADLAAAPRVLAVGDLHIENFGTWRDSEGRLIWGVNDLDEAWPAAYTIDLVRLLGSVYLAIEEAHLRIPRRQAAEVIEQGYRDALGKGGEPFVLAENHRWLRLIVLNKLRDPVRYWDKMEHLPAYTGPVPPFARRLLEAALPAGTRLYQLKRRVAGMGSLGHPRILALASLRDAWVAREIKAIRPSAWVWARKSSSRQMCCSRLNSIAVRVQDPFLAFDDPWLVRRLAPDCSRIELASLPRERSEAKLLYAMGFETGNMHLGSASAIPKVKRDLARRKGRWLHHAAKDMCEATEEDWKKWRRGWQSLGRPPRIKRRPAGFGLSP